MKNNGLLFSDKTENQSSARLMMKKVEFRHVMYRLTYNGALHVPKTAFLQTMAQAWP